MNNDTMDLLFLLLFGILGAGIGCGAAQGYFQREAVRHHAATWQLNKETGNSTFRWDK